MSYEYPRNKKRLIAINGVWDPTVDTDESERFWYGTGFGFQAVWNSGCLWTVETAPGGAGGVAHKLWGRVGSDITKYGVMGISYVPKKGWGTYFSKGNPFQWRIIADFRMYIVSDQDGDATHKLSHCGGFCIDGNDYRTVVQQGRLYVNFNVTTQYCGIARSSWFETIGAEEVYKQAWTGSYNTYYDIRVIIDRDWFADPNKITITVFQNKVQLFSYEVDTEHWRNKTSLVGNYDRSWISNHAVIGRCGPHIVVEQDGGAPDESVIEVYFKDIYITMDHKIVQWSFTDSIIGTGRETGAKLMLVADHLRQFGEGDDVLIWERKDTSSDWIPQFRGITREISAPPYARKLITLSAEGWESVFWQEKTENVSYATKTADYIIKDIINNPSKGEFSTDNFVDSTSITYTRNYPNVPKMDVLSEMGGLEGFINYFDYQNEFHFESFLKKQIAVHLVWGESRILDIKVTDVFVRTPNIIRVIGNGYRAEREVVSVEAMSGSKTIQTINRLELQTQNSVDDALAYYISGYRESIKLCTVTMRANIEITKGCLISLTVPHKGIINQRFLVSSVSNNSNKRMTLELLEAKPQSSLIISDLSKRAERTDSQFFPQDDTTANPVFNVEALGTMLIDGNYEVIYSSVTQREGKIVITDDFLDDLVDVWSEEDPDHPTYLAYGTGINLPLWEDTALQTETSRAAVSTTFKELIGVTHLGGVWEVYRCIEFTIDIASPSNLTEVGLFNAASSGTMACRGVFDSYTQSGTVTLKIYLRIGPKPSGTIFTTKAIKKTIEWMKDGTRAFISGELNIGHSVNDHFMTNDIHMVTMPHPSGSVFNLIPFDRSYGTSFTITKIYDRNMVLIEFVYPDYDYTEGGGKGSPDPGGNEFAISLFDEESVTQEYQYTLCLLNALHRSDNTAVSFDGKSCLWRLYLKFEQGWIE